MRKVTIATSIVPRNLEQQRAAIESWLNLGFKVVSLNSREEAEVVGKEFPDIPVRVADRSAESIAGKPYVFLDDVLSMLLGEHCDICGIVNSDIHLNAGDDFGGFILDNAQRSLIFGGRIDVESPENLTGEEYFGGFDFFFFDRELIRLYPETDFCLGAPWWDFWAPLVPIVNGVSVKQLVTPIAYHPHHPVKWSGQLFNSFGLMFAEHLLRQDKNRILGQPLLKAAETVGTQIEAVDTLALLTLYYLKLVSVKISYVPLSDADNKHGSTVRDQIELEEKADFYQTQFRQIYAQLSKREGWRAERLKALHQCQENLREMQNSKSWRLTAPLRGIAAGLQSRKKTE